MGIKHDNKAVVFVYSIPKVGSTTIVSSLRIFATYKLKVIHVHDEVMLSVLAGIKNVTINQIIEYNRLIGKKVYVIDIYRSPIEHKISVFFEKLSTYHFNCSEEIANQLPIGKVISRFNSLFTHLTFSDYFFDKYDIPKSMLPSSFDHQKKYILVQNKNITYIKLRLKDSTECWSQILTDIFQTPIYIYHDYDSKKKIIAPLYRKFLEFWKIPRNFLENILTTDSQLDFYYSADELSDYFNNWKNNSSDNDTYPFSYEEYALYNRITIENQYLNYIQTSHYIDEGCDCNPCVRERIRVRNNLLANKPINDASDRIEHLKCVHKYVSEKMNTRVQKINIVKQVAKKKGIRLVIK